MWRSYRLERLSICGIRNSNWYYAEERSHAPGQARPRCGRQHRTGPADMLLNHLLNNRSMAQIRILVKHRKASERDEKLCPCARSRFREASSDEQRAAAAGATRLMRLAAARPASRKLLLTSSGRPLRVLRVRCHWQQRDQLPGSGPRRGLCAERFVTPNAFNAFGPLASAQPMAYTKSNTYAMNE